LSNATQSELTSIREAAAFARLPDRAFLRIAGSDAARWLNGMVTNSIQSLAPGQGNYNFLLNAQGRIQGDCTIYREPEGETPAYILETDSSQLDAVHQHLDRFIIMDDVELAVPNPAATGILLLGPDASGPLMSATHSPLPALGGHAARLLLDGHEALILTPPRLEIPAYEIWFTSVDAAEHIYRMLRSNAIVEASPEAIEALRILSATPKFGQDIRNSETARDLPQETAQTHALHFSKGCYLGQEIVERIHSRGQVHRTFTQFRLTPGSDSQEPPTLPAALQSNGKPAGELTSAALVPGLGLFALGYVRREALDLHQTLTYAGGRADPIPTASKN
jgi:folate-binding protein YgfZ